MTELDDIWARIQHPRVRAGIRAAQDAHDRRILAELDATLDPIRCDTPGCPDPATTAAFCRHTGDLLTLHCNADRERLLAAWRHRIFTCRCSRAGHLAALISWSAIFTRSTQ